MIYGGFGENQKCISDKTIAELHNMKTRHVREVITNNISRFKKDIDFIDLKIVAVMDDNNLLSQIGYTNMEVGKSNHIYILSKRGYAKLIKIFDTDLAWEVYEKLLDEYFYLKKNVDIGEKRLYKWLRKEGYLIKVADDYNTPTQKSLNMGLFKIKKYTITNSQGEIIVKNTVMVTPKGQLYFTNKFLRNIKLENPRPVIYGV